MTFPNTQHLSSEEHKTIHAIVDRIWRDIPRATQIDRFEWNMNITAVHAKSPLDLDRLLQANTFNFTHDTTGIYRHLNRTTYELENCFLPRFTKAA